MIFFGKMTVKEEVRSKDEPNAIGVDKYSIYATIFMQAFIALGINMEANGLGPLLT